jgi:hypothetical protein
MTGALTTFTLGNFATVLAIIGSSMAIIHTLKPVIQNHQRNIRWLETLWEEYNIENNGDWRIAPGNPSERLHVYRPRE